MGKPAPIGVSASGQPNLGDQANAVLSGVISAVGPTAPFSIQGPMNLLIWCSAASALTTTAGSLAASVASATGLAAGSAINSANVPKGATIGALSGTDVTLAIPPLCYPVSWLALAGNKQVSLPPGSNVSALLGATVTVPSDATQVVLPAATTVAAVIQPDVAPSLNSPGVAGIIQLSALPTAVGPMAAPVMLSFAPTGNAIRVTGADAAASYTDAALKYDATVQLESSFDGGNTFNACNIGGAGALAQYVDLSSLRVTFGEPERQVLYRLNCIEYTSGTINYRISATGQAPTSLSVPAIA